VVRWEKPVGTTLGADRPAECLSIRTEYLSRQVSEQKWSLILYDGAPFFSYHVEGVCETPLIPYCGHNQPNVPAVSSPYTSPSKVFLRVVDHERLYQIEFCQPAME
jgi:hypothetical protein